MLSFNRGGREQHTFKAKIGFTLPAFLNLKPYNESIKERQLKGDDGSVSGQDLLENKSYRDKFIVDFGLKIRSLLDNYDYLFEYYPDLKKRIESMRKLYDEILERYYN